MSTRPFHRVIPLAAIVLSAAVGVSAHADPTGKWRIELNHKAENDGSIVLRVTPVGGDPIDVATKIPSNTRENRAAKIMRDSMQASLGDGYHVETDDGEDVLIKARGKTPKFDLTLVSSSVTGLQIELEHD